MLTQKIESSSHSYTIPIILSSIGGTTGIASCLFIAMPAVALALAAIGTAFALIGIGTALFIKFYFNKKAQLQAEIAQHKADHIDQTASPPIVETGTTITPTAAKLEQAVEKLLTTTPIIRIPGVTPQFVKIQQPLRSQNNTIVAAPKPIYRNILADDPKYANEIQHEYFVKLLTGRTITIHVSPKEKCGALLREVNKVYFGATQAQMYFTPINSRLTFMGKVVSVHAEISSYEFHKENCMHLMTTHPFREDNLFLLYDLGYADIKENFVSVNSIVDRIVRGRISVTDLPVACRNRDALKGDIHTLKVDIGDDPSKTKPGKPDSFWDAKLAALRAKAKENENIAEQEYRIPENVESLKSALRSIITNSNTVLTILEDEIETARNEILRLYPLIYVALLQNQTMHPKSEFPDHVVDLVLGYACTTEFQSHLGYKIKEIQDHIKDELESTTTVMPTPSRAIGPGIIKKAETLNSSTSAALAPTVENERMASSYPHQITVKFSPTKNAYPVSRRDLFFDVGYDTNSTFLDLMLQVNRQLFQTYQNDPDKFLTGTTIRGPFEPLTPLIGKFLANDGWLNPNIKVPVSLSKDINYLKLDIQGGLYRHSLNLLHYLNQPEIKDQLSIAKSIIDALLGNQRAEPPLVLVVRSQQALDEAFKTLDQICKESDDQLMQRLAEIKTTKETYQETLNPQDPLLYFILPKNAQVLREEIGRFMDRIQAISTILKKEIDFAKSERNYYFNNTFPIGVKPNFDCPVAIYNIMVAFLKTSKIHYQHSV